MANNRLYLKCKSTGEKVLLAKYYPSTGWYSKADLRAALDSMFHKADFGETNWEDAQTNDMIAKGGMWGRNDFELEYEMTEDKNGV